MAKRLVVCCDGTWNRPDQAGGPTNVAKLSLGVLDRDDEGRTQLLFYHRGVGTDRAERLRGGAFGLGLSRHVRECYRFVVENFQPGDELFFFGFSRGAFTARSTVGLIRNAGILRPEHTEHVAEAYRLYRSQADPKHPAGIESRIFRKMYSHPESDADIHFVGVWDTVGALGIPGWQPSIISRRWSFHDTKLSSSVHNAFQALAVDERRGPFQPTLWQRQPDTPRQTLAQVWFTGVHSDIGGGYREPALAEITLKWMIDHAQTCGLALDPDHFKATPGTGEGSDARNLGQEIDPNPLGQIHNSRKGPYLLLRPSPRMLLDPEALAGSAIASSAVDRHAQAPDYRPANLTEYLNTGPETVHV